METARYASKHDERRRRHFWQRLPFWVCTALILVMVGVVVVVWRIPARVSPSPPPQVLPVNVTVWHVTPMAELADTFDLTAVVEPEAVVHVAAEVAGRIERLAEREQALAWRDRQIPKGAPLEEGQPIVVGEPILYMNQDLLRARYDRAVAQYDYDLREHERIKGLFQLGNTSRTEFDDARTKRDISKALMDEASRELERTTIAAPISGILNQLPMEVGEFASPGDTVAEIVNIDLIKIVVQIPERDVYYLKVGQLAEVFVNSPNEKRLVGEITYISEIADQRTRTTRLEITVDNRDHALRSGQIVRTRLTRRVLADVLMIPLASVIPLEQGHVVYVVDEFDRAQPREVELGFIKGHDVRVLSGLQERDRLIVSGHRYVGPGQPVTIVAVIEQEQ